jgi:hypothetical protein
MTRVLHGFTCLVGLCAISLVVGCGSSSSKKVTCDGSGCTDAKKDAVGDTLKQDGGTPDVVRPDVLPLDTGTPTDTVRLDGATTDTPIGDTQIQTDTPPVTTDTRPVTDTRPDTTPVVDTRPADTQRDTTPADTRDTVSADRPATDTPVLLDAAPDTTPDAPVVDAPIVDAPEADAALEAGSEAGSDAEDDAT